ncbi:MAG: hypothetical protein ACYC5O_23675 [Anaerolineae bacterium]
MDCAAVDTGPLRATSAMTEPLLRRYLALWWQADGAPEIGATYSPAEQQRREGELDRFLAVVRSEARQARAGVERESLRRRVSAAFGGFACQALDFGQSDLDTVFSSGLLDVVGGFARQARQFDPEIGGEDVFQASRNVLTMAFLQLLWGLPLQLTPAITAYSLLYPYSDNYLDDPTVDEQTKVAFSGHFRAHLEGAAARPANGQERVIFALVDMIVGQYDRAAFAPVYESLLAIHAAQERSVRLLRPNASPYDVDVLGISIEKGGASVLADGYLVCPTLTPAQADFAFGLGALLQLGDDLQDVEADRKSGLLTVFSQTAGRWPLDGVTDRALSLGNAVLSAASAFEGETAPAARALMAKSAQRLFLDAAGQAGRLFSNAYIADLERHSPFRFAALRRRRQHLGRLQASLPALLQYA